MLNYFTEKEINNASFGTDEGFVYMSVSFLQQLDDLRHVLGFPLKLTCAYRTKEHDLSKGRSGNSKHTEGIAVDIACTNSQTRAKIIFKALQLGFRGIGIHKDFVHLDTREEEPVIWLY